MNAHTPGPWMLATSCSWRRIIAEYGGAHVCMPEVAHDGHPDLKISDADAALIVAAPLLLEALEEARIELMAIYRAFGPTIMADKVLVKVRTAVEAARGAP